MDNSVIRNRPSSTSVEDTSTSHDQGKQRNIVLNAHCTRHNTIMPDVRPGADGDLESVVECPVCLVIPRDLPIPSCPAGQCQGSPATSDDNLLQVTLSASPAGAGCCIVQPVDDNSETTRAVWPRPL